MDEKIESWTATQELASWILDQLEDNDTYNWDTEYEQNYAEGYHDAMLYVLDYLGIKHNKEYYFQ